MPTPRTASEPNDDLDYPVLVKPSDPVNFRRVFKLQSFRCENRAELDESFEKAKPYDPIIQELIPGGDDELYTLGSYVTRDGEALGLFSGRKLRQTPPTVGSGRVCESVWVDEMVDQGLQFIRGLGFHGLSQVEFKRDPRDGVYKLMEINPRIWQWHGLAAATGVDLPAIAYRDLLGESQSPVTSKGKRKRWAVTLHAGTKPAVPRLPYRDGVFSLDRSRAVDRPDRPARSRARPLSRLRGASRGVIAFALAAPLFLLFARLLPEDGAGLYIRLLAATICVLVLPGALLMRALAWQPVPALALTGSLVLSLAVAMGAFAITFLVGGTITLALLIMGLVTLAALVPAALARVYRDEPWERLAFVVLVVAALAYGGVVWWVSHSLGTGDVLFHLARARKIADGETLSSLNVVNEFRDGGLHPGYAFPLWHGVLAAIARLAGVDVSLVVLHLSSVLVPFAFAAAYAAGRALTGSWPGGVAVLAAQAAALGFSRDGTGAFQDLSLPGSQTRAVLVTALLAFLFAYLREREGRLLDPARPRPRSR